MSDYFMPVERRGTHYEIVQDWIRSNLDPIPSEQILERLETEFDKSNELILFQGELHQVIVFVSHQNQEYSYVATDFDGVPSVRFVDNAESTQYVRDIDRYRAHLFHQCQFSESILPEQRTSLDINYQERDYILRGVGASKTGFLDWRSISDRSRVLIVGAPGAGKTSLLRRIAIGLADATNDCPIPVYLQLRHWHEDGGIQRLVRGELSALVRDGREAAIESAETTGRFIFLLDGLDEIPTELQRHAWSDIESFIGRRATCRYIISTRPSSRPTPASLEFEEIGLGEMTQAQVKELCWRRLPGTEKPWTSFWNRLASEPDVFALAKNPLILTLLVARFLRDALSPHFVGEVVALALEALTDEWDSVRGIKRTTGSSVSPKVALTILKQLATEMSKKNIDFLSDEYCFKLLENRATPVSPQATLARIEGQSGILRQRQQGGWEFAHKAVREYLAATSVSGDKLLNTDNTHATSREWWRYRCSEGDWATELLPQLTNGPYKYQSILLATDALSQRLVLSKDVIRGFCLGASWLFEQLVIELEVEDQTGQAKGAWTAGSDVLLSCSIRAKSELELFNLVTFVSALRNVRDGDASEEISDRLKASASEKISKLAPLLWTEGRLVFEHPQVSDTPVGVFNLYAN